MEDAENHFRKPTMKDVAEAAGVSISTVSHVLNRTRFVSADIKTKVEEAILNLKFTINPIARHLRSGESRLVGFVVSNLANYFYLDIARGIEKTLKPLGYQLVLIDSAETKKTEIKNIESLYNRGTDGIIIAPTTTDCTYLKTLLPPDFPLVFVDRQPADFPADNILLDNFRASYDATKYLLKQGNKRIGFVSFHYGKNEVDATIMERIEGYKKAYQESGLELLPEYIRVVPGTSSALSLLHHAEPYHLMKDLHACSVQAVLCGNSLAAIGVFTFLKEKNLRIPQDMGLITFDNDLWLSMTTPRISAIVQPSLDIGVSAAKRLFKRIQRKELPVQSFRLPAEIIFRESC